MPLFDILCLDCGETSETLVMGDQHILHCHACGSHRVKRLLSAHSSISGTPHHTMPGPGDTACCGSSPDHASCAGPGSCCGKRPA